MGDGCIRYCRGRGGADGDAAAPDRRNVGFMGRAAAAGAGDRDGVAHLEARRGRDRDDRDPDSPGCNGQGGGGNDRHPVLGITWWDAVKWCNLVSQINDKTPVYYTHPSCKIEFLLKTGTPPVFADWNADGYRLPTEAEWESACCPGTSKRVPHRPYQADRRHAGGPQS